MGGIDYCHLDVFFLQFRGDSRSLLTNQNGGQRIGSRVQSHCMRFACHQILERQHVLYRVYAVIIGSFCGFLSLYFLLDGLEVIHHFFRCMPLVCPCLSLGCMAGGSQSRTVACSLDDLSDTRQVLLLQRNPELLQCTELPQLMRDIIAIIGKRIESLQHVEHRLVAKEGIIEDHSAEITDHDISLTEGHAVVRLEIPTDSALSFIPLPKLVQHFLLAGLGLGMRSDDDLQASFHQGIQQTLAKSGQQG